MKIALLFLCLTTFALADEDENLSYIRVPFERGVMAPPAVSVFYDLDYNGIGSKHPQAVIGCIWPDGRAVWSRDRTKGGPPYFTGHVEPKRLAEFVAALDAKGIFAHKVWYLVGVDAPHHDINIIDGQRRVALSATGWYTAAKSSKTPDHITEISDAVAFVRQQFERLLPRQGQKLSTFDYELRRIP